MKQRKATRGRVSRPEESAIDETRMRKLFAVFKRNQEHANPNKRFPTLKELAAMLDPERPLSDNTMRAVLRTMREEHGMPVDFAPARGGHGFTEPVAGFPLDAISEQQVYDLIQSLQMLGLHRGRKAFQEIRRGVKRASLGITLALGRKFEEIESVMSFHVVGFDAPAPVDPLLFKAAMRAILRRKEVRLEHRSAKRPGEVKVCVVEPLHLGLVNGALYLWHYDPAVVAEVVASSSASKNGKSKERATRKVKESRPAAPDGIRKFALTRIGRFEETGRTFDPARHGFDIAERMKHGMGAYDETDAEPVRLRFTRKMAPYIAERTWHETQQIERLADGGIEQRLHVAHTPELEAYVLRWAGHVEVLEPAALRARMREVAEALARAHA